VKTLFPFLKDGGFYVAEDLQTNFGPLRAKYKGAASASCVDFLESWAGLLVAGEQLDLEGVEDAFLRTYARCLEFVTFHRHCCILKKKAAHTDWRLNTEPPLAAAPPLGPQAVIHVIAHFGLRGDMHGPHGHLDLGADRFTIQGFAVESEANAVECRVRYPDETWSPWAPSGQFVGTRGKSIALTGFTARLREDMKDRLRLRSFGRFVGVAAPVEAADGEDCVSPAGRPLRGIQFDLAHHGL
jgi:hypothetical protein